MNKAKTKVVVKKNTALYYADLKSITTGNPLAFFKDQSFERITDMVLNSKENQLLHLTSKGKIGIIALEDRTQKTKSFKISQLMAEKNDEHHSKDSSEQLGSSRYYTLRIAPDDDYIAVVSTEKTEGGLSFGVIILKLLYENPDRTDEITGLAFSDRVTISDGRASVQGADQRAMECIPQYVNFSIKSRTCQTNVLMVFIRGYSKFFMFPVEKGKIGIEQSLDMFPQASMIDSGLLVDDGCMYEDTIFVTLQSPLLLKITFKVD